MTTVKGGGGGGGRGISSSWKIPRFVTLPSILIRALFSLAIKIIVFVATKLRHIGVTSYWRVHKFLRNSNRRSSYSPMFGSNKTCSKFFYSWSIFWILFHSLETRLKPVCSFQEYLMYLLNAREMKLFTQLAEKMAKAGKEGMFQTWWGFGNSIYF